MEIIQDFNAEKRDGQRQRLMDNKVYQAMGNLTKYMDRYYLDALFGLMPGWGDLITVLSAIPFIYFSAKVIKSIPLTLAVINNSLRDAHTCPPAYTGAAPPRQPHAAGPFFSSASENLLIHPFAIR